MNFQINLTDLTMVRTILLGLSIAGLIPTALVMATVLGTNRQIITAKKSQLTSQPTETNLATSCQPAISPTVCSINFPRGIQLNSNLWLQDMAKIFFSRSLLSSCITRAPQSISYTSQGENTSAITPLTQKQGGVFPLLRSVRNSSCLFTWQNRRTELTPKAVSSNVTRQNIKPNIEPILANSGAGINASLDTSQAQATSLSDFPKLSRSSLVVSSLGQNSNFTTTKTKLLNPAPKTRRIASPFGWRKRPYSNQLQFHQGIDYGAPLGSPVVAVENGIVTNVSSGCADFGNLFCGGQLGNWIEVDHGNGAIATYGHLKHSTISVTKGVKVWRNQEIAQVGSSGWSTGAHLDFRIKVDGSYQDPAEYVMQINPINKAKVKTP